MPVYYSLFARYRRHWVSVFRPVHTLALRQFSNTHVGAQYPLLQIVQHFSASSMSAYRFMKRFERAW